MRSVVRLVMVNWALGMAAGVLCATLILAIDLAGLRALLLRADDRWIGLLLLYGSFAFSFGGLVAATAVMTISDRSPSR
ncbi:hypothetical protein [Rhodopseudomonas sp. P2A-2r]|uniref:hypothetical protein n=1 Tax=unclassified Rhodopseudomonas TaxID=2638247 RepID=UPI0022345451|nr:hypothetical protein [Rhodopseudomonas sp. P2A-2r]UZE51365.1 hypothetical protein ONR75_12585 [Rhodopseudomonas sp. P2A-2r]